MVQCACLDYPVREFAKANSTSFLFEYFILPTTAVYFILHYPFGKPLGVRILYYAAVISAFTIVEVIIERFHIDHRLPFVDMVLDLYQHVACVLCRYGHL